MVRCGGKCLSQKMQDRYREKSDFIFFFLFETCFVKAGKI